MDVAKHLDKAAEAAKKKNFDYAVELYHQVLQLKPDHGEARRALRDCLVRRAEYKKIPAAIAVLQGLPGRLSILIGRLTKNHGQVILSAEKSLRDSPRNEGLNRTLAEALERAGHLNSAVAVWEFLGEAEGGDDALKRAGALYYQMRDMQKALGCYETVLKRTPRDSEAEKMRKNLAAEGVLSSGSYDPTKSSRELARDKDKLKQLETDQKMVVGEDERTAQRRRFEEALAKTPGEKRVRTQLVEFLVKSRDYRAAIEVLDQGIALDPEAFDFKERRGDIMLLDFERQIRDVEAAASRGDAAAKTDLVDLRREKLAFEVEEFERRVADHPTDLDLRWRLARLHLDSGKVDAAIENFQQAVKDPRRRIDSLLGLGVAFERKGLLDLAKKQLDQALEGVDANSDRGVEIRYALGTLLERKGDARGAIERYEGIFERDIHYKDVAVRLEKLRASGAASTPSVAPAPASPAGSASRHDTTNPPSSANESRDGASTYDFKD
jgi:tetratricopeptide (TPR) repeat protein